MTKRKRDNEEPTFDKQMETYAIESTNPDDPIFSKAYHTFMTNLLKNRDRALANELAETVSLKVYEKLAETLAPVWTKLEDISTEITAIKSRLEIAESKTSIEEKRIEEIEAWQRRKKVRIEKIEKEIALLQPESIKMISEEIQKIRPELEWFICAFKWWKILIYVATITGLWFLIHYFWLVE